MAIYLQLDGIKGSATDFKFKDQIECTSFQWGAGLGVGAARGGDRSTSEPSVSEMTITKNLDKATEPLFKSMLLGSSVAKGKFTFTAASKGESVAFLTIDLEDVIVSGWSTSASGSQSDFPGESLNLNIGKFDFSFTGRDKTQAGQATHLIYDLVENKVG